MSLTHLVHDHVRDATQVVSSAQSPEYDASCAKKQLCLLRLFAFPTDDVTHRAVVQALCMDTRSYRYCRYTTGLSYKYVCTGTPAGLDERVEYELRY